MSMATTEAAYDVRRSGAFDRLASAFREISERHDDRFAEISLAVDGVEVFHARTADSSRTDLFPLRSATKGVAAIVLHVLARDGDLDLDEPISSYWPQFGENGKAAVTLHDVMVHRAGLPFVEARLGVEDLYGGTRIEAALAGQKPAITPGTGIAYHDLTFGWIAEAVARRAVGRSLSDCLGDLLSDQHNRSLWIGLPVERHGDVRHWSPAKPQPGIEADPYHANLARQLQIEDSFLFKSQMNPPVHEVEGDPAFLKACIPGANGVGNAGAIAEMFSRFVAGGPTRIGPAGAAFLMDRPRRTVSGLDVLVNAPRRYCGGFMLPDPTRPMGGLETDCFGHYGAGGALAFASPERRLGFCYLTSNHLAFPGADPRTAWLASLAMDCVERG